MGVSAKRYEAVRQPSEFGENRYARVRESRFANSPERIAAPMSQPKRVALQQPSISEPWQRPAMRESRFAQAANPLPMNTPQRPTPQQPLPQMVERSAFAQRPQQLPTMQTSTIRNKPAPMLPAVGQRSSTFVQRPQLPPPGWERQPFAPKAPDIAPPQRPSSFVQRPQQLPASQPSAIGRKQPSIAGVPGWERQPSSFAQQPKTPWTLAVNPSSFRGAPAEPQGSAPSRFRQEPPALPSGDAMLSTLSDLLARRNEKQEEKNPGGRGIRPSRTYNPFGR